MGVEDKIGFDSHSPDVAKLNDWVDRAQIRSLFCRFTMEELLNAVMPFLGSISSNEVKEALSASQEGLPQVPNPEPAPPQAPVPAELELSNEKDPKRIELRILQIEKMKVEEKKEELAKSLTPLIESTSQALPINKQLPTSRDFVEMIIEREASDKAKKGNQPSATRKDLINLKRFLTRASLSVENEGAGQMNIRSIIRAIRQSISEGENSGHTLFHNSRGPPYSPFIRSSKEKKIE